MRSIRFYQTVIIITLLVYVYYLFYRVVYTINPDAIIVSILFFSAEFHGLIALFLYFFQMWHPLERRAPPFPAGMTVDFYITTYNENIGLVRETALGCLRVSYLHDVYILDDGDRPEFRKMAEEIGCHYIRRGDHKGAKAGNLNHALPLTKGEFIAVFDADYVPQPDFLEKTLGYFEDPKVAFVQTPQQYYNVDSFTFRIKKGRKRGWHEQEVFYRQMMPGRDYWDSAFFVGTGAIFRRKALEDIGGFAVETLTEDLHTTLRLYAKKWKGIYHNEILATGLAAQDIKNYHIQKLRWGEGNVSLMFKKENPLLLKGLTIPQRIAFFATIFSWTIGFPKIIYFTMPSIMILFEKYPIIHFDAAFLVRYAIFLITVILGVKIVSKGYTHIRNEEIYNMMNFFVSIRAVLKNIKNIIFKDKSKFIVTGKGRGAEAEISYILPQICIVLFCYAGVIWGVLKLYYGITHELLGVSIGIFWASINGLIALTTVKSIANLQQRRSRFRFIDSIPVVYRSNDMDKLGVSRDINPDGISLVTFEELQRGQEIPLSLYIGEEIIKCTGEILYIDPSVQGPGRIFGYGIRLKNLSSAEKDRIARFCFHAAMPKFLKIFENKKSFLTQMLFYYSRFRKMKKRSRRMEFRFPVMANLDSTDIPVYSVTDDISESGFSMRVFRPVSLNMDISLRVITSFGEISAKGKSKRVQKEKRNSSLVGIAFSEFGPGSYEVLNRILREK